MSQRPPRSARSRYFGAKGREVAALPAQAGLFEWLTGCAGADPIDVGSGLEGLEPGGIDVELGTGDLGDRDDGVAGTRVARLRERPARGLVDDDLGTGLSCPEERSD